MQAAYALLIDLDGVLRIAGKPAPGLAHFIGFIQGNRIPACILSNTTKLPVETITRFFQEHRIDLTGIAIHTALLSTHDYVKRHYDSVKVYCIPQSRKVFSDIPESAKPRAVVVGDLEDGWTYPVMNEIFRHVMEGADLIAMQMNRYSRDDQGNLILDAGAFIKAIEYGSGKEARLMGKPSRVFFHSALEKIHASGKPFFMIGDDLVADIDAGKKAGGQTILVLTGKTDRALLAKSSVKPDYVAENLDEVIHILQSV